MKTLIIWLLVAGYFAFWWCLSWAYISLEEIAEKRLPKFLLWPLRFLSLSAIVVGAFRVAQWILEKEFWK